MRKLLTDALVIGGIAVLVTGGASVLVPYWFGLTTGPVEWLSTAISLVASARG